MTEFDDLVARLAEETGFLPVAAAFALGATGNYADAKGMLAEVMDDEPTEEQP